MKEIFKYCPSCNKEETVTEKEPKIVYVGTDGFGQMVKFSKCECGGDYGWLFTSYYKYKDKNFNINDLKDYFKQRIRHYYRG